MKREKNKCRKEKLEQVRAFDQMYTEMEQDNIVLQKTVACIVEVLSMLVFLVCCGEEGSDVAYIFLSLYYIAMYLYLCKYVNIKEEGCEVRSIYEVLSMMPVRPDEIFQVRKEYVWKLLKKRVVFLYAIELVVIACTRNFHWKFVVWPIGIVVLIGILLLWNMSPGFSKKKDKQK